MNFQKYKKLATALWIGYLYCPLISENLVEKLYPSLIYALQNRTQIDEIDNNKKFSVEGIKFYIGSTLYYEKVFSEHKIQETIAKFSDSELDDAVIAVYDFIAGSDNKDMLWPRVEQWLKNNWPEYKKTEYVTEHFVKMLLMLDEKFLEAYEFLINYLVEIKEPSNILWFFTESKNLKTHPEKILMLLLHIIDEKSELIKHAPHPTCFQRDLSKVLDILKEAQPAIVDDPKFKKLNGYCK